MTLVSFESYNYFCMLILCTSLDFKLIYKLSSTIFLKEHMQSTIKSTSNACAAESKNNMNADLTHSTKSKKHLQLLILKSYKRKRV